MQFVCHETQENGKDGGTVRLSQSPLPSWCFPSLVIPQPARRSSSQQMAGAGGSWDTRDLSPLEQRASSLSSHIAEGSKRVPERHPSCWGQHSLSAWGEFASSVLCWCRGGSPRAISSPSGLGPGSSCSLRSWGNHSNSVLLFYWMLRTFQH